MLSSSMELSRRKSDMIVEPTLLLWGRLLRRLSCLERGRQLRRPGARRVLAREELRTPPTEMPVTAPL
jgi:hypothetical protein